MIDSIEAIESRARSLTPAERAELVVSLLDSLEDRPANSPSKTQARWLIEADERYQALIAGTDPGLSHDEIFTSLRSDHV